MDTTTRFSEVRARSARSRQVGGLGERADLAEMQNNYHAGGDKKGPREHHRRHIAQHRYAFYCLSLTGHLLTDNLM